MTKRTTNLNLWNHKKNLVAGNIRGQYLAGLLRFCRLRHTARSVTPGQSYLFAFSTTIFLTYHPSWAINAWWLITWLAKEIVSETEMNTTGSLSSGLLDLLGYGWLQGHRDDVDSAEAWGDNSPRQMLRILMRSFGSLFPLAKPES